MSKSHEDKEEPNKHNKHFILDKKAVRDSLVSLTVCNSNLRLLNFGNILVRHDYVNYEYVKIISGGPSGHEPAHGGYVGKGMLTAAIQGDIFISPPATEILRALREITFKQKSSGAIVLVPNDTGTCLNFGVAVQKAANEGIRIRFLTVKDDVSHPNGRGLTGIILIQKIAGALSETGATMNNILNFCERVSNDLYTVMITLKPSRSPTEDTCICTRHFGPNNFEIGEKYNVTTVKETCEIIMKEFMENCNKPLFFDAGIPIVVLINNLGNTSILEQQLFVKEFLQILQSLDAKIVRFYCGHYMTTLDAAGFTVTILKLNDPSYLVLLDAPTEAPHWTQPKTLELDVKFQEIAKTRVRNKRPKTTVNGPSLNETQSNILLLSLQFACDALLSCEKQLNTIDSESGDGDTGTRLRSGIQAVYKEINERTLNLSKPFDFLLTLSQVIENSVSGTLGCIYSIFFEAAANTFLNLPETEVVNAKIWIEAFRNGVETLRRFLNVEPGGNSMLDPLYAGVTTVKRCFNEESELIVSLDAGLVAAEEAVQKTRGTTRKFPDPGAHAVGIWMRAVFEAIKLRCI